MLIRTERASETCGDTPESSHFAFLEKLQDRLVDGLSLMCVRLALGGVRRWVRSDTRLPPCAPGSLDCSYVRV